MNFHEPGSLEVFITVAMGRLIGSFYKGYVDRLRLQGNERVLDFGSGSGNPARYLAPKLLKGGGRLTCVDVSRVWMQVAQRRLKKYPNVEFKLGDIATLDIPDASHDVVFIHFVLHDIPTVERADIVKHLARRLKPGGTLFIREPVERGGIPAEDIRRLMKGSGLEEVKFDMTDSWFTGPIYEGTFSKIEFAKSSYGGRNS